MADSNGVIILEGSSDDENKRPSSDDEADVDVDEDKSDAEETSPSRLRAATKRRAAAKQPSASPKPKPKKSPKKRGRKRKQAPTPPLASASSEKPRKTKRLMSKHQTLPVQSNTLDSFLGTAPAKDSDSDQTQPSPPAASSASGGSGNRKQPKRRGRPPKAKAAKAEPKPPRRKPLEPITVDDADAHNGGSSVAVGEAEGVPDGDSSNEAMSDDEAADTTEARSGKRPNSASSLDAVGEDAAADRSSSSKAEVNRPRKRTWSALDPSTSSPAPASASSEGNSRKPSKVQKTTSSSQPTLFSAGFTTSSTSSPAASSSSSSKLGNVVRRSGRLKKRASDENSSLFASTSTANSSSSNFQRKAAVASASANTSSDVVNLDSDDEKIVVSDGNRRSRNRHSGGVGEIHVAVYEPPKKRRKLRVLESAFTAKAKTRSDGRALERLKKIEACVDGASLEMGQEMDNPRQRLSQEDIASYHAFFNAGVEDRVPEVTLFTRREQIQTPDWEQQLEAQVARERAVLERLHEEAVTGKKRGAQKQESFVSKLGRSLSGLKDRIFSPSPKQKPKPGKQEVISGDDASVTDGEEDEEGPSQNKRRKMDESSDLPPGWARKFDERRDVDYYVNEVHRFTQWPKPTRPAKLVAAPESTRRSGHAAGGGGAKPRENGATAASETSHYFKRKPVVSSLPALMPVMGGGSVGVSSETTSSSSSSSSLRRTGSSSNPCDLTAEGEDAAGAAAAGGVSASSSSSSSSQPRPRSRRKLSRPENQVLHAANDEGQDAFDFGNESGNRSDLDLRRSQRSVPSPPVAGGGGGDGGGESDDSAVMASQNQAELDATIEASKYKTNNRNRKKRKARNALQEQLRTSAQRRRMDSRNAIPVASGVPPAYGVPAPSLPPRAHAHGQGQGQPQAHPYVGRVHQGLQQPGDMRVGADTYAAGGGGGGGGGRPRRAAAIAAAAAAAAAKSSSSTKPPDAEEAKWACSVCTFENHGSLLQCEMCTAVRPRAHESKPAVADNNDQQLSNLYDDLDGGGGGGEDSDIEIGDVNMRDSEEMLQAGKLNSHREHSAKKGRGRPRRNLRHPIHDPDQNVRDDFLATHEDEDDYGEGDSPLVDGEVAGEAEDPEWHEDGEDSEDKEEEIPMADLGKKKCQKRRAKGAKRKPREGAAHRRQRRRDDVSSDGDASVISIDD